MYKRDNSRVMGASTSDLNNKNDNISCTNNNVDT